jgi:hypothetical protein
MGLDLRWPIGLMFSLLGVLLTGYGALFASDSTTKVAESAININLIWGLVLLAFGVFMIVMAVFGKKKDGEPPKN